VTRRLLIRPGAEEDLAQLFDYIADASGRSRAVAYVERLRLACHKLLNMPNRGRLRADLGEELRSVPANGRATIVYRVNDDDSVEIFHIFYAGRAYGSDDFLQ